MKPTFSTLIVLILGGGSLLAAAATPVKGAKEIFFAPTDGALVSASHSNSFKAPTAPQSGKTNISTARPPKKEGTPPPRVGQATKPTLQPQDLRPIQVVTKTSTLGLSYWIELVGQDGKGQQVTENRIFKSGERIRLHFRTNGDGNIALIQLGSSGTSSVLFPDPAKGLGDSRITAGEDRILPTDSAWFRFDDTQGTEKVLVLFAKSPEELDTFSIRPTMDATATMAVLRTADGIRGSKDLILETETEKVSEIGTYGVNLAGKPVVMEIQLRHQ